MRSAWSNFAPMNPVAGTDANGESWNIIPNRVFLKAGGNTANSGDADRFVTSVAHLQTFLARPGRLTYTIIDLREASLYATSHIRSALNFPVADPDCRSPASPPRPPSITEAKLLLAPSVEISSLPPVFQQALGKDYVIFHCLQSAHRGPMIATAWANYLKMNGDKRSKVVLLNGGWNAVDRWCKSPAHFGQKVPLQGTDISTIFGGQSFNFSIIHSTTQSNLNLMRRKSSVVKVTTLEEVPRSPLLESNPMIFLPRPGAGSTVAEEPSVASEQPPMKRLKLMFSRRLVSNPYA